MKKKLILTVLALSVGALSLNGQKIDFTATDLKDKAAVVVSNISGKDWRNTLDFGEYGVDVALVIDEDRNLSLAADTETPGAKTITCEVRMQTAIGGTLASIWRLRYFAKHKDEN